MNARTLLLAALLAPLAGCRREPSPDDILAGPPDFVVHAVDPEGRPVASTVIQETSRDRFGGSHSTRRITGASGSVRVGPSLPEMASYFLAVAPPWGYRVAPGQPASLTLARPFPDTLRLRLVRVPRQVDLPLPVTVGAYRPVAAQPRYAAYFDHRTWLGPDTSLARAVRLAAYTPGGVEGQSREVLVFAADFASAAQARAAFTRRVARDESSRVTGGGRQDTETRVRGPGPHRLVIRDRYLTPPPRSEVVVHVVMGAAGRRLYEVRGGADSAAVRTFEDAVSRAAPP